MSKIEELISLTPSLPPPPDMTPSGGQRIGQRFGSSTSSPPPWPSSPSPSSSSSSAFSSVRASCRRLSPPPPPAHLLPADRVVTWSGVASVVAVNLIVISYVATAVMEDVRERAAEAKKD
jgi:hypothetical protein